MKDNARVTHLSATRAYDRIRTAEALTDWNGRACGEDAILVQPTEMVTVKEEPELANSCIRNFFTKL